MTAEIDTFITLHKWMLRSPAFRSLRGNAVKLLLALASRYNGHNNGEISCSIREAACEVGCVKNHAVALFAELLAKGFITRTQKGHFDLKKRHASTYKLNWLPVRRTDHNGLFHEPTKEFMRWRDDDESPETQNVVAPEVTDSLT